MAFEDTQRYMLETPEGEREWEALLPLGGGIIRLGEQREPATISMFHQLDCLNIMRKAIVAQASNTSYQGPGGLERHCINYVRQMVLCRSDIRLENVKDIGLHSTEITSLYTCRDWEVVYQNANKNIEDVPE
ncbi:hypothetical protein M422DRAFT_153035 [Sphaerobolus stellatus SS14]|nr:hypothetical protein M422DRAFT_153035 [Sphaerobolus stellatus SS14]